MALAASQLQLEDIQELRKDAGRWLRTLREAQGLSQRQIAEAVGIAYYTFVSQLETGRGRIPSDQYMKWAEVLGVEPREFVRNLMRYYDPVTFELLFPEMVMSA
jgi:transcriptional regulator with XRE-family HTH domain